MNTRSARVLAVVGVGGVLLSVSAIGGHTVITPPNNKYTPAQDVELGRKAAVEVEQQLPILREEDEEVTSFVVSIGRRLVESIPQELRHPEFRYSFQVVNAREINAFALPGGPMYLNSGMIEAAHTGGEVAGVADGRLEPGRVAPLSSTYTVYTEGDLFRVSVPSNWRELPGSNTVIFAPDGAYGSAGGQGVFTHGVEIGVARNETHDLRSATDELVASLARANPNLSRPTGYDRAKIGGRQGLRTVISNVSDATSQQERIAVFTVLLRDASLFYALGVAPRGRFSDYEGTFRRVVGSIQIMD